MGLMQYLVAEHAITYEQRGNRHSCPDAHSIGRNHPRYRQSVGIAGVVDAQERVTRPDRRRLDECVDRTKRDALNLFQTASIIRPSET